MSGFAGMISLDGAAPDRRLLEKMASRLAFRGPDGTHIKTLPGAGFCFTFLRTGPAPQCPSQPCTLDGRVWLLGDVRLDGRDDVRRKLEQSGEELSVGVTDEELVLRTWQLWGEEGIAELIGDYAFALWDPEARQLRCWRDLMGARPFFYAQAGGWFYFSNTLNAIRCAPGISRDLDHHFIGDFLLQGSCSYSERTAFRDIARVPAGHRLSVSAVGMEVHRYASFPIEEPSRLKSEDDYVTRFRELLEQAVIDRLPRGAAAIYMSGGLDSTSVAAIAARVGIGPRLRAYTIDCQPELDDDEGRLANVAARYIRIPIEIRSGICSQPLEVWRDQNRGMPEPLDDPYCSYPEQFATIAGNARVVLNGYGGDGVLTGQTWPYLTCLWRQFRLGQIAKEFGGYIIQHRRWPPLRNGFRSFLARWVGLGTKYEKYPSWLNRRFESRMHLSDRWRYLCFRETRDHPWHPNAYHVLNNGSWANVLEPEDAGWTHVSLESRAPLLDSRVQSFLLTVPPVPLCINKELLRRAVRGELPEEVRLRRKTPFAGDLLAYHRNHAGWNPLPLPAKCGLITDFVDVGRLADALAEGHGSTLWADLRPLSLLYWLDNLN